MKKLLLLCLTFLLCFAPNINTCFAEEILQVRVIYSNANVYSTDDILTSQKITTLKYNDILTVIQSTTGTDGYEYYLVELQNVTGYSEGYVFKSQVLDVNISSPAKKLDNNASVLTECNVYILDGKNYIQTNTKLSAGTKIKILSGYNTDNEYTQIQYTGENEEIVTAYIKTNAIAVSGISITLIGAIIIIVI